MRLPQRRPRHARSGDNLIEKELSSTERIPTRGSLGFPKTLTVCISFDPTNKGYPQELKLVVEGAMDGHTWFPAHIAGGNVQASSANGCLQVAPVRFVRVGWPPRRMFSLPDHSHRATRDELLAIPIRHMLNSYREIVYGIAFGLTAALLDTALDARAENQSFLGEIGGHPAMMLYRVLFILLGWFIGWLLWRDNTRERNFRQLMERMRHFHHEYEAQAVVLHTNLQLLLTKNLNFSPEDQAMLRATYEKSRDLQILAKERPEV